MHEILKIKTIEILTYRLSEWKYFDFEKASKMFGQYLLQQGNANFILKIIPVAWDYRTIHTVIRFL
jgi:hypothetical protein